MCKQICFVFILHCAKLITASSASIPFKEVAKSQNNWR